MLLSMVSASVADALSNLGFPVANMGGIAATSVLCAAIEVFKKREKEALDIFFDEIKDGNFRLLEVDTSGNDAADCILLVDKYFSAAREGMSNVNMRILGRLINNFLEESGSLSRENFDFTKRNMDIFSSLSIEEMYLIAITYSRIKGGENKSRFMCLSYEEMQRLEIIKNVMSGDILSTSLMRTGMVVGHADVCGLHYSLSTEYDELLEKINIEHVFRKEDLDI